MRHSSPTRPSPLIQRVLARLSRRRTAYGVAAALLVVAGAAIAGLVKHSSKAEFDASGTATYINANANTANSVRIATVTNKIDNWYRGYWDGSTWDVQLEKDDNTEFNSGDRCLRADQNPNWTTGFTNPITLSGVRFRPGPDDKGIGGVNYVSSVDEITSGDQVVPPAGITKFTKLRFLTAGSKKAQQTYKVKFTYSDATTDEKTVTIKLDTVTGAARNSTGTGFTVTGVTGAVHNTTNTIDADGDTVTDCQGDGADVVDITNANPTKDVDFVTFEYVEYATGVTTGWLGGPLAITLLSNQTDIENTFTYFGEYDSPTSTTTAVGSTVTGHAIYYDFIFNPAVTAGSSIELFVRCGDDTDSDGTLETAEYTGGEQSFLLQTESAGTAIDLLSDCVGRYLRYRMEFTDEFADTTSATPLRIDDIQFDYDLDLDQDGYGALGLAGAAVGHADCNDNDASVHWGVTDTAGDGIDKNCDGLEICYQDNDNDNYRTNSFTVANDGDCNDSGEAVATDPNTECNDNNAAIHPGVTETTGDGVDFNCDGQETCYADADNDGNRHTSNTVTSTDTDCNDANEGVTGDQVDCDDNDPGRFVGNPEVTGDQKDQDCNGQENCWPDLDNDDARASSGVQVSSDFDCADTNEQVTAAAIDCDDGDNTQYPGNTEIVGNGKDNDCSILISPFNNAETCYLDADDDGYPDPVLTKISADEDCTDFQEGTNLEQDDCDETRASVHPNATDVCGNGLDDNCNGVGDNGHASFLDDDGDGLLYASEVTALTSDCDSDSDNDNLNDYDEVILSLTSPIDNDSDNDNMKDDVEVGANHANPTNTDNDGLIDAKDPDDDNDGNNSINEDVDGDGNPRDDNQDGDALVNVLDVDDDGDGVITDIEDLNNNGNYTDDATDADGVPNWLDNDDDGDGILTTNEDVNGNGNKTDDNTDGTDNPNYIDSDDDNDGVQTINENVNGVSDARDDDTDVDGTPNYRDTDDDNDSILTSLEYVDGPGKDVDADGIQNHLDLDSDGDGYTDVTEGRIASDGDGIYDYLDIDADGDTVNDLLELNEDFDLDGKKNRVDNDDDGDGITTSQEQIDLANGEFDADGFPSYRDTDSDGDNWPDAYEWTVIRSSTDDDADGKKNYVDKDCDGDTLLDKNELGTSTAPVNSDTDTFQNRIDSDDDGDCVLTKDEIGNPTPGMQEDFDVDGLVNYLDTDDDNDGELSCAEDANGNGNAFDDDTDSDGDPNHVDQDDDNDDVLTIIENTLTAGRDVDGDGKANGIDTDSDGDGWNDDDETIAGVLVNFDADANPDFVDTDSDNDLVVDSREGSTANHRDTDFDGDLDRMDTDDDDDQIPTAEEWSESNDLLPWNDDFDNDGIADYMDFDDDNDGVLTFDEDVDNSGDPRDDDSEQPTADGKPDYLDTDDDNDTILTIFEDPNTNGMPLDDDTDSDFYPNYRDYDDDGDLLFTANETLFHDQGSGSTDPRQYDFDNDGLKNYLDADDDNDFVDTYCEVYTGLGTHLEVDADADTILDGIEWYNFLLADPDVDPQAAKDFYTGAITGDPDTNGCETPWDRDSDSVPNLLDSDDDNDGLSTGTEELGTDLDCLPGTEVPGGDGIPDYLDSDSDNDGILDADELIGVDTDGDFVVDFLDCDSTGCAGDSDRDGIRNCDEGETLCAGLPDFDRCPIDPDYDSDGVIDGVEVGANLSSPKDFDNDGIPDFRDTDDDDDDLFSWWENGLLDCLPSPDNGNLPDLKDKYMCLDQPYCNTGRWYFECDSAIDGTRLTYDFGGNDLSDYPNLDAPTGGPLPLLPDTTPNLLDTDDDGDGKLTSVEGMGDADGDGLPNAYDPYDSDGPQADPDGDGLITEVELYQLHTLPYDSDSDDDALSDGYEVGPDELVPWNHDGTPPIDALDPDDDDDTVPTAIEGTSDPDADGVPSYLDDDSDGDGKLDADEGATEDVDCDGVWNSLDANDADGPCLNDHAGGTGGPYVNRGCTCESTGGVPGGAVLLVVALAAGTIRRRRSSVAQASRL